LAHHAYDGEIRALKLPQATFKFVADEYIQEWNGRGKACATVKKTRWLLDLLSPVFYEAAARC